MARKRKNLSYRLIDRMGRALIAVALRLPYAARVRFMGWMVSRVIAPLAGHRQRIRANLALVRPELPAAEVERLVRAVPENTGRMLIEIYSGYEFIDRVKDLPLEGPGVEALRRARDTGTPVVLVTGHFGNYDAVRAALVAHGHRVAALYRPLNNPIFNDHYVEAMQAIGPVHPRDKGGFKTLLRHLKHGGMLEFLVDQHISSGAEVTFFGRPALTATSAAELALKHDAPLIPMYGIRQPDGLSFRLVIEAPVPASDAETMTQALNDSLEAVTRDHMDQWMWSHQRWKGR